MISSFFRNFTTKMPACDFVPTNYVGPTFDSILKIRFEHLVPCLKTHFETPILIHQGHMQWLFDHKGRRYLDMFGGIVTVSVGHCHPKVNAALRKQIKTLWHTTNIYLHPKIHEYAEKLTEKLPKNLKIVYFVNSGSEANDLAIMMARLYTRNLDIIALKNCYHGGVSTAISLTAQSSWKFSLPSHNIYHARNPDVFKGPYGGNKCKNSPVQTQRNCNCKPGYCEAANFYADDVNEILEYSVPKKGVAAFIAESIQGVGGVVEFPKNYLRKVYDIIRDNGGICIADEVQTGFGRTGSHFWGFQNHNVVPDIVTMAKGIGNGFPLGAVITTPEIATCLTKALHFNTFGGNPMASAVGLEVLRVIEEEKLQENCHKLGTYFLLELDRLRNVYEIVGDVRGKGFMIGVEFVQDKNSKKPLDPEIFKKIWECCKNSGVLIGVGGAKGNVMRIKPPMCITKEDIDFTINIIEEAIIKTTRKN